MKKKLLIAFPIILVMLAAGYFLEPYIFQSAPDSEAVADMEPKKPKVMLFKMPLGKFTLQVVKDKRNLHMNFNIDVYIAGSAEFERMNGAMGRVKLRDATVAAIAEIAETALWVDREDIQNIDRRVLVEDIVRRLYRSFPMVQTARINEFAATVSVRE